MYSEVGLSLGSGDFFLGGDSAVDSPRVADPNF